MLSGLLGEGLGVGIPVDGMVCVVAERDVSSLDRQNEIPGGG